MEKIKFSTPINASAQKIWTVLWDDNTYPQWTAGFGEGGRVKTDWKEGSKVLFLGSETEGMVSRIVEIRPNEYVSFQHQAAYKNGVEDAEADEMKDWVGAHENYLLQEQGSQTQLTLEQEVPASYKSQFETFWEKAFQKIKELSEN